MFPIRVLFSVSNVDDHTADSCKTADYDTNGACGETSVCRKSVNFGESSDKGECPVVPKQVMKQEPGLMSELKLKLAILYYLMRIDLGQVKHLKISETS